MSETVRSTAAGRSSEIADQLRALIGQPQVSEAYLRFRIDLLEAQEVARQTLARTTPEPPGALQADQLPLRSGDVARWKMVRCASRGITTSS